MLKLCKVLGAATLFFAGSILFQPVAQADTGYTMNLYSTYNGASATIDGLNVLISPYTAHIYQGSSVNAPLIYNGSIICDDFTTDIPLPDTWSATVTNADDVSAADKFWDNGNGPGSGPSAQADYNAAAYLANVLISDLPTITYQVQTDLSEAIWTIFDPSLYGQDTSGAQAYVHGAFAAVAHGPVYDNVTVWTADPPTGSQEFLVVGNGNDPNIPLVQTPEPTSTALLGFDFLSVLAGIFLVRRYRVRA